MSRASQITRKLAVSVLAAAALAATSGVSARADELRMQVGQSGSMDVPGRGMTMTTVQSRFGSPSHKLAAVGQPPITRWEYPSYIVYFEYDHVIHSVPKQLVP